MKKIILILLFLPSITIAQEPGELDSSFAVNGKLVLEEYQEVSRIEYIQPDKIQFHTRLISEPAGPGRILQYDLSGELDTTFGSAGYIPALPNNFIKISDERYLEIVSSQVLAYDVNMALDTSFGNNGVVQLQVNGVNYHANSLEILPDNKLLFVACRYFGCALFLYSFQGVLESIHSLDNDLPLQEPPPSSSPQYRSMQLQVSGGQLLTQLTALSASGPPTFASSTNEIHNRTIQGIVQETIWSGNCTMLSSLCPYEIYGFKASSVNSVLSIRGMQAPAHTEFVLYDMDPGTMITESVHNPYCQDPLSSCYRVGPDIRGTGSDPAGNFFIAFNLDAGNDIFQFATLKFDRLTGLLNGWGNNGSFLVQDFEDAVKGGATVIEVQPDGKVLVGGWVEMAGVKRFAVVRYHNIPDPRSKLHLKMFLGGPYDPATGLMNDDLRQNNLIPFIQPYQPPAFQPKNGVGTWGLGAGVLDLQGDSAIVDWVWLELLDPDSLTHVKATRVGLLHRNGKVTTADGVSPIDFSIGAGSYMLRVRHRNHLSVTLADPITLGLDPIEVDLTLPATATFGTDAQKEVDGVMMLWPGDASGNGMVSYVGSGNDRDRVLIKVGSNTPTNVVAGYFKEDVDLDGSVKYTGPGNDRDVILQTIGGNVPTAVRVEQGP